MIRLTNTTLLIIFFSFWIMNCGGKKVGKSSPEDSTQKTDSSSVALTPSIKKMDSLQQKPKDLQQVNTATMLKYIFKKGDVFSYRIHTITHVEEQTDTLKQISNQDVSFTYHFEVLNADPNGGAKLQATCTQLVFYGKYGNREMSYNSDSKIDKTQEKLFAQYNAPLNIPFEVYVNAEGTLTSVSKVEKIVEKLMGNDFKKAKADAKKKVAEDYANVSLKDVIQLAFQKLSEKPVANDSAWNIVWEGILGFLKVKNVATYTLLGVRDEGKGKLAHIGIQMRTNYVGPPKMETGQGVATIERFDVKGTGTTLFDLTQNRSQKRVMEQVLVTKLSVDPPPDLKKEMPNIGIIHISQRATISHTIESL